MPPLLREPLLIFTAIGGSLFFLYDHVVSSQLPVIAVSPAVIEQLVTERELVLDRKVTAVEEQELIDGFIDQEVLVRDAIARDLHLHDGRIRHRLADKMLYLLADEPEPPTDLQLEQHYQLHKDEYRSEQLVSFTHRYFADKSAEAAAALSALQSGKELSAGQRFWMGPNIERASAQELVTIFGTSFTRQLETLPIAQWQGPIESDRGWHLVMIEAHYPPQDIPREHLQQRLQTQWMAAQRTAQRRAQLDALRDGYEIVIGNPGD